MKRLFYSGDVNIEHGGYFYSLETYKWGYVEAMRCTPCSDAGGPDNMFWIEELVISIPKKGDSHYQTVINFWGDPNFDPKNRHQMTQATASYGRYDQMSSICIRIGPKDPLHSGRGEKWEEQIDYKLRSTVDLRKLVRRMALGYELTGCVKPLGTQPKGWRFVATGKPVPVR